MMIISKIKKLIWKNLYFKLLFLFVLLFLNSFLEVIGIGMIIPIYNLTVDFENFSKNISSNYPFFNFLFDYDQNSILILLFITFLSLILLKYIVYIFSNSFAINLTADLKAKITSNILIIIQNSLSYFLKKKVHL